MNTYRVSGNSDKLTFDIVDTAVATGNVDIKVALSYVFFIWIF